MSNIVKNNFFLVTILVATSLSGCGTQNEAVSESDIYQSDKGDDTAYLSDSSLYNEYPSSGSQTEYTIADNDAGQNSAQLCDNQNSARFTLFPQKANATAGPTLARALIEAGERVDITIRNAEFLNYYRPNEWRSSENEMEITAGISLLEDGDKPLFDLYVALSAPMVSNDDRRPLNLTIVLDNSPTMGENTIKLAKNICRTIVKLLREDDVLSITTLDPEQTVLVESISLGSDTMIDNIDTALSNLALSETTDIAVGLKNAYLLAEENRNDDMSNRVMLISDGNWELGITDKDKIATEADFQNEAPIYLVAVGIAESAARYNISMMRLVSEAGRGPHIFIDGPEEIERSFENNLSFLTDVSGAEVMLDLKVPPAFEIVEENDKERENYYNWERPLRNLPAGGTMVLPQKATICDPEAIYSNDNVMVSADYYDPIIGEFRVINFQEPLQELLNATDPSLAKIKTVVQYAETLRAVATLSDKQAKEKIAETIDAIDNSVSKLSDKSDDDVQEIRSLLEAYSSAL